MEDQPPINAVDPTELHDVHVHTDTDDKTRPDDDTHHVIEIDGGASDKRSNSSSSGSAGGGSVEWNKSINMAADSDDELMGCCQGRWSRRTHIIVLGTLAIACVLAELGVATYFAVTDDNGKTTTTTSTTSSSSSGVTTQTVAFTTIPFPQATDTTSKRPPPVTTLLYQTTAVITVQSTQPAVTVNPALSTTDASDLNSSSGIPDTTKMDSAAESTTAHHTEATAADTQSTGTT